MALTHIQCRQAPAKDRPYKLAGGGGLYLLVNPNGQKYWRYKYRFGGKEKTLALGVFPEVSLTSATAAHKAAREVLSSGKDPAAVRKDQARAERLSQAIVFKAVAQEWRESKKSGWSDDHIDRMDGLFKNHIDPEIGDIPMGELTSMDVLDTIRKMEREGLGESCYKALAAISKVCLYATVTRRARANVAAGLSEFLKAKPPVEHHRHMEESELGKFLNLVDVYGGLPQTRIATKLIMLCFMRSAELRNATWAEIDFDAATWTIPSSHRKGSKTLKASESRSSSSRSFLRLSCLAGPTPRRRQSQLARRSRPVSRGAGSSSQAVSHQSCRPARRCASCASVRSRSCTVDRRRRPYLPPSA
ncbi:integrase arm-type DNA-binding domain-containing protein [Parapusillimonas sp. SGNA-6]|nr:integrase arm-type DNA-binding domain-containing protein [Parapusillimonas sp. SGNA-6]